MTATARNDFKEMARQFQAVAAGCVKDFNHANETVAQMSQELHAQYSRWALLCETVSDSSKPHQPAAQKAVALAPQQSADINLPAVAATAPAGPCGRPPRQA